MNRDAKNSSSREAGNSRDVSTVVKPATAGATSLAVSTCRDAGKIRARTSATSRVESSNKDSCKFTYVKSRRFTRNKRAAINSRDLS